MLLLQPYHLVAPLLLLVAAGRCLTATGGGGGDDGRQFAYNGFTGVNLTLDGAVVTPNGLLQLTKDGNTSKGQAFHPSPLSFRTASNATSSVRSFSTTFVFAIDSSLSSNGMAFFVSASKEVLSTALSGQFLGLLNATNNGNRSSHMFAVELDTFKDDEFNDINNNHVGIDVNSLVSRNSTDAGYYDDGTGQFLNISLRSWKSEAVQVWVDYDSKAREITVTMAPFGVARPKVVDLSCVLQSTAFVGFSSTTDSSLTMEQHFVLGWSFALDGPAPALNVSMLSVLQQSASTGRKQSSLMAIVLVQILLFIIIPASAIGIGIYMFVRWRRLKHSEVHEDWEVPLGPNRFSYKDLFHATEGFGDKNLLGRGGFESLRWRLP